jgi:hypothetical protein
MATKRPKAAPERHIPLGRPSGYTQEMADIICERLSDGESLRKICLDDDMPAKTTVFKWLGAQPTFANQYARAREVQAETMAEEILEISDETSQDTLFTEYGDKPNSEWISRSKLRVEARKWLMSKMAPKKYGEKLAIGGADDLPAIETKSTLNITGLSTAALAEIMAAKDAAE